MSEDQSSSGAAHRADWDGLSEPRLPVRDPRGHKGTFGRVAVVGGCACDAGGMRVRMIGAPALAALGALRAGAGLAVVLAPEPVLGAVLTIAPSATGMVLETDRAGAIVAHSAAQTLDRVLDRSDVLAIGPGLGSGQSVEQLVLRAVSQTRVPVVVDADALNALARTPAFDKDFHANAVLTPHPGEFARLAAVLGIAEDPTDPATRPEAARALARRIGTVVVLKGAGTVVSDGQRVWTCRAGHPCLATAGTGDVLTGVIAGVIAGIIAQFDPRSASPHQSAQPKTLAGLDLFDAARAGVLAHALAGERWAADHKASAGLLAGELAALIPLGCESIRT